MQNYTPKLLITFKMEYYLCFSLEGNLDFLKKIFITSTTGWQYPIILRRFFTGSKMVSLVVPHQCNEKKIAKCL